MIPSAICPSHVILSNATKNSVAYQHRPIVSCNAQSSHTARTKTETHPRRTRTLWAKILRSIRRHILGQQHAIQFHICVCHLPRLHHALPSLVIQSRPLPHISPQTDSHVFSHIIRHTRTVHEHRSRSHVFPLPLPRRGHWPAKFAHLILHAPIATYNSDAGPVCLAWGYIISIGF
jgi:hypothetical protein